MAIARPATVDRNATNAVIGVVPRRVYDAADRADSRPEAEPILGVRDRKDGGDAGQHVTQ